SALPSRQRGQPAHTEPLPLSLHDALPIWAKPWNCLRRSRASESSSSSTTSAGDWLGCTSSRRRRGGKGRSRPSRRRCTSFPSSRSEEHTSELQSRENLVCRLLLEKKKQKI